ncbi:MAG: hypothetical protein U9Q96_00585 [Patescibacteria group bacterium]|nr:hypothetical protein [Patescibacteria group bacterium]
MMHNDRILVVFQEVLMSKEKCRSYWQMKGWRLKGDRLVGRYQTPFGSMEGYIKHPKLGHPLFFIVNPPQELSRHEHWGCFQSRGHGHFLVHFGIKPNHPDSGIRAVEKVLMDALAPKEEQRG